MNHPVQSLPRNFDIVGVEFNSDKATIQIQSDITGRPGTNKRVEHQIAFATPELNAWLDKLGRKSGEVPMFVGLGVNIPNGPQIPVVGTSNRLVIVDITFILAEQEQVLVTASGPIFNPLGLAIRLVLDDIGPHIPT